MVLVFIISFKNDWLNELMKRSDLKEEKKQDLYTGNQTGSLTIFDTNFDSHWDNELSIVIFFSPHFYIIKY